MSYSSLKNISLRESAAHSDVVMLAVASFTKDIRFNIAFAIVNILNTFYYTVKVSNFSNLKYLKVFLIIWIVLPLNHHYDHCAYSSATPVAFTEAKINTESPILF